MEIVDVAIVGAGPYGLSLSAHLSSLGISHRIFGKPLQTWRHHMPKGMFLKSEGFASNLSAPDPTSTLREWCAARRIGYADQRRPVELSTFNDYASWFQARYVPHLETDYVVSLQKERDMFVLALEHGEQAVARSVVLAIGITSFANRPTYLNGLSPSLASHSYDHHELGIFKGRTVTVIGAGSSAVDTAVALADEGADVRIVARAPAISFHSVPDPAERSLLQQLKRPSSGIGPGWRSFLCVNAPLLFHAMPEQLRLRATKRHLGPASGWFMRERVEGRIPMLTGHSVCAAHALGDEIALEIVDKDGQRSRVTSDHVIAATGYRPDLRKLSFLAPVLRAGISDVEHTPTLSDNFETSVKSLYATGPLAANAFGPLMRFMYGAEFAAPRLAQHLAQEFATLQRAA